MGIYGPIGYSKEIRQVWANEPFKKTIPPEPSLLSMITQMLPCWGTTTQNFQQPSTDLSHPVTTQQPAVATARLCGNPYAQYVAQGFNWSEGEFVIDLDKFLNDRSQPPHQQADKLSFGIVGCQGIEEIFSEWYASVIGRKLSNVTDHTKKIYQFNLILGNNFYHHGVTDPNSSLFRTTFNRLFKHRPSWCYLGPYDYNFNDNFGLGSLRHPQTSNLYRAMCQVAHSYYKHENITPDSQADCCTADEWNMPYRYYVLVSQKTRTIFLGWDSNTLIFDLDQQDWVINTYQKLRAQYPHYKYILISHHPLNCYSNDHGSEWEKYVQRDQAGLSTCPRLKERGTITTYSPSSDGRFKTIGQLLKRFLTENNLIFHVVFSAYENLLAYERISLVNVVNAAGNTKLSYCEQFVSGGGGAALSEPLNAEQLGQASRKPLVLNKNWGYMTVDLSLDNLDVFIHKASPDKSCFEISKIRIGFSTQFLQQNFKQD